MTALDEDLAGMRQRLIAALHDQPVLKPLGVATLTAAVDVAMATAGLRDVLQLVASAEQVVAAVGDTPPPELADAVDAYMGYRPAAGDRYPTIIP